ncbi:uncharacterized protein [Oscarella lobularis]|uniref:uncharacterized protein isoform X1 n=1 Tax=Oscarella lobularis TaxID=121494 RepID=UPI003313B65E
MTSSRTIAMSNSLEDLSSSTVAPTIVQHPVVSPSQSVTPSPELFRLLQHSSRRKAFLFIAVFDVLLMLVIWVLIVAIFGLIKQIDSVGKLFDYEKSLFDLVALALGRMLLLLVSYWILKVKNRWVVLFVAAGSTAYLVAKVFYYDFNSVSEDYLEVFFIVACLVIVWTEFAFYELKVLPVVESSAYRLIRLNEEVGEREPLIRQANRGPENNAASRRSSASNEEHPAFVTPRGSPTEFFEENTSGGGDDYDVTGRQFQSPVPMASDVLTAEEVAKFVDLAKDALEYTIHMAGNKDLDWKEEKRSGGIVCEALARPRQTKLFRCSAIIDCCPKDLFRILYVEGEKQPSWNSTVLKSESLYKIDDHSDISYNVAAEAAGGIVSSRDFVSVRYWDRRGPNYISAGTGINFPNKPEVKGITRGLNGPGGYVMNAVADDPGRTRLIWVLDTDLKGWIPQYLIDKALSGVLITFFEKVANYYEFCITASSRTRDEVIRMRWFEGSVSEAIQRATTTRKLFIVYVEGNNEDSKKMANVWTDAKVIEEFERVGAIALKIGATTAEYQQFSKIYPVAVIPSTYFIGEKGFPLEVGLGYVKDIELVARLKRADDAQMTKISSPSTGIDSEDVTNDAQKSQKTEIGSDDVTDDVKKEIEPSVSHSEPALNESDSASSQTPSIEERKQRAKAKLEEIRRRKAEQRVEEEKRRELSRRELGQDVHKMQEKLADQRAQERAKQLKKKKEDDRKAREVIRAQIEKDRVERAQRFEEQKVEKEMERTAKREWAAMETKTKTSDVARIQFRFSDGWTLREQFASSQTLCDARAFILENASNYVKDGVFSFSIAYPRREVTSEMETQTFEELGLTPTAILVVKTPQEAKKTTTAVTSWGKNPIVQILLLPFLLISSFFSFIASLFTTTTTPKPSPVGVGGRSKPSSPWRSQRDGNIHRMKTDDDDDDENNTWNGNSTQQQ